MARAAVIAVGVPGWVFPGALIVMALGLPVVLFAWYADKTRRQVATLTPRTGEPPITHGTMATLALKAPSQFTWQRAWLGGAIALGSFAALVAGFMILRSMGIGPAGSLLAAGRPHEVLPLSGVSHMTPQDVVAENLLLLQVDFLRRHLL